MTNYERIKNLSLEKMAAEFMIFRPSDACFEDEHRNYYSLNNQFHKHSQECFKANVEWLKEETGNDAKEHDEGISHGCWKIQKRKNIWGEYMDAVVCSECGGISQYGLKTAYCSKCGANMDGGKTNERG